MTERKSVRHPNNYNGWEEDIVAAAVNAAGLVVAEEDRLNPALTDSDAQARGKRVGIMAKAILEELAK
jgi:hypothetical protein